MRYLRTKMSITAIVALAGSVAVGVSSCGLSSDCEDLANCAPSGPTGQGGTNTYTGAQGGNSATGGSTSSGGSNGIGGAGGTAGAGGNLGADCGQAGQCDSGFCVDDVCCESACDSDCRSCALTEKKGYCTPYVAGTDPESECEVDQVDGVCDGSGHCAVGNFLWSAAPGNDEQQYADDIAAGPTNDFYIVGDFKGSINWGATTTFWAKGYQDAYLVKLSSDGTALWGHHYGDVNFDQSSSVNAGGVATDASGNVYVAGYYTGEVNFGLGGGNLAAVDGDIYVAKYNAGGVHQWSDRYGSTGSQKASDVAADSANEVIVTGYFYDSLDFAGNSDAGTGMTAVDGDIFVAKFNVYGHHIWSNKYGDTGNQYYFFFYV